jgi:hypothetical protein
VREYIFNFSGVDLCIKIKVTTINGARIIINNSRIEKYGFPMGSSGDFNEINPRVNVIR